jgi:hypothetical protein
MLVACAKRKQAGWHAARELYVSPLFSASRRFAEARADSWYILSGRYGVLTPGSVIESYDLSLNTMRVDERRNWARAVNAYLSVILPPSSVVTFLAGKRYHEFLVPHLREEGHRICLPLAHLRRGEQVQWLQRSNRLPDANYEDLPCL